jgi:hypothetical protein
LFLGIPVNPEIVVRMAVDILRVSEEQAPEAIALIERQSKEATRQKQNLIDHLKQSLELTSIVKDELLKTDQEEKRLKGVLESKKRQQSHNDGNFDQIIREKCASIINIWETGPVSRENEILKMLITGAVVDTRKKTVDYKLTFPMTRFAANDS